MACATGQTNSSICNFPFPLVEEKTFVRMANDMTQTMIEIGEVGIKRARDGAREGARDGAVAGRERAREGSEERQDEVWDIERSVGTEEGRTSDQ